VDDGGIVELSRGLYQLAESAGGENIDFITVCARAPHGMVCLNSALAHWDLTDELPHTVHLAVPAGSHRLVVTGRAICTRDGRIESSPIGMAG